MKISVGLVVFAAILAFTHGFEMLGLNDVDAAHKACQASLRPVPVDLAVQFMTLSFPKHPLTACYIQCLLAQLQMYDEDKKAFQLDNIKQQMTHLNPESEQRIVGVISGCMDEHDVKIEANCEWVAKNFLCVLKDNRELLMESFSN